jgi:hypothetical protein
MAIARIIRELDLDTEPPSPSRNARDTWHRVRAVREQLLEAAKENRRHAADAACPADGGPDAAAGAIRLIAIPALIYALIQVGAVRAKDCHARR